MSWPSIPENGGAVRYRAVVNLFFGWTLIGWVAALAMAVRMVDRVRSYHPPSDWSPHSSYPATHGLPQGVSGRGSISKGRGGCPPLEYPGICPELLSPRGTHTPDGPGVSPASHADELLSTGLVHWPFWIVVQPSGQLAPAHAGAGEMAVTRATNGAATIRPADTLRIDIVTATSESRPVREHDDHMRTASLAMA